ncbi:hypothetical protein AAFF_G00295520 [Aldrovandia affinis]|uniref:Uncharacterized protein n=1 Tax=Aldrovandia affinis TaxID=143900 RepID=A0AAD7R953_9TELE|nr:hypothetical protein AAFF_G00295520 [Aldrovandia affinis]
MKAETERERPNSSTVAGNTASEQEEEDDTMVPEVTEPDLKPTTSPSGPAHPTPPKLLQQLRESLSLLELDFTEFRELTLARLAESDTTQQLRHELQQLKQDSQEAMAELRRENQKTTSELKETQKRLRQLTQTIRELEEENSTLRAQTLKLKEDTANRDLSFSRELQQMKEQLQEKSCHVSPSSYTHATVPTPTLSPAAKPSTPPDPGNSPIPQPSPTSPTLTPRDSPPDTHSLPAAQPLNTEPNPDRPAKPEAQVVLLMDSNGKYLDTKRLFPGLITRAKRCRNTGQAMELLRQDTLGNPQYIVVHTGTNDLHTLHRETAEAMTKMAKRASREFPNSRVVISTLLPRTDTPPHVIHEINMEISRSCAALPNIHLAHHTNIGTWDLHDRLHLNKRTTDLPDTNKKGRGTLPPIFLQHHAPLQRSAPNLYPTLLPHPAREDPPTITNG